MHLAKSGRLIVRLIGSTTTKSGELLFDLNGKPIGKVIEIIGPVNAPYASVAPMTDRVNKIIGIKVYSGGFLPKGRVSKSRKYGPSKVFRHNDKPRGDQ